MRGSKGVVDRNIPLTAVAIASHELKTPLVLLRQLGLSLESDTLSDSDRRTIVHHINLVTERMLRLTTDITKVERLEEALFEMEPVNPQQICEEVIYEIAPLYKACERHIEFTARRQSALAVANRDLLRRILLNFADNALYHSEKNHPVTLLVQSRDHGSTIRVGVRDFGPSVPTKVWQSLTQWHQRNEQLRARPSSSGLGLSIARQFAESMQGTVGVVRHKDGATFYVDIAASRQLSFL